MLLSPPFKKAGRIFCWLFCICLHASANAGTGKDSVRNSGKKNPSRPLDLKKRLHDFYPLDSAEYSVTLCADVPVNSDPGRVYTKGETGHVFIILSKKVSTGEVISSSFGFYPKVPVTFLVKKVRSKIMDNSNRDYDVAIEKKTTPEEFAHVLEQCLLLARKKYNLKKYNCYDYALGIFNTLAGNEKLPVTYVKFPFIFGKGGSPCGLFKDLKRLSVSTSSWAHSIRFGKMRSPGDPPKNALASY